jgi:hypothetical protein
MRPPALLLFACAAAIVTDALAADRCKVDSRATVTPVIELYTSEGCSSCPPADRWVSSLKGAAGEGAAVVQAFHVGYWDSLGWVDRFASPAYTTRQRQVAAWNGQSGIYTPQVVRNGADWHDFAHALAASAPPRAAISLSRTGDDSVAATVSPVDLATPWSAYWTVTENGHSSKVKAGENAGEFLQHDFVVRQYVPAGTYRGRSELTLHTIPSTPGHPRQVNLVVFDPRDGKPLQAVSLSC